MSQQHLARGGGTEGPYASTSVVNGTGADFSNDLEAGPPERPARPRSAQERRRASGTSRSEMGTRSQIVSERPQSTTVSKVS